MAGADLILCGYTHIPLVQRTALPNGRAALVVRGSAFRRSADPSTAWWIDYLVLTHAGDASHGYAAWEYSRQLVLFQPRDRSWTWDQASRSSPNVPR